MTTCCFKGCSRPTITGKAQCEAHKRKRLCASAGCTNMVNKRGLCVRHGARDGLCSIPGCHTSQVRVGGMCYAHSLAMPRQTSHETRRQAHQEAKLTYASGCETSWDLSEEEFDWIAKLLDDIDDDVVDDNAIGYSSCWNLV
ncbi:Aste57867_19887 [Aphanomyces stellatus]|uniref:Aste57867_19887 protein n=1 Tax=Aphanomyces stellatus TaxID=120398 RepID=A0A485LE89_9STRA|nr:hypothetical protein As57867_019821 [Aphanomyces stellatus]VFT96585.1 Aste57867_19887 [Aphanomyces stellatus]